MAAAIFRDVMSSLVLLVMVSRMSFPKLYFTKIWFVVPSGFCDQEQVTPVKSVNDPMVRAKFQVKAALMHIMETEQLSPELGMIAWEGRR